VKFSRKFFKYSNFQKKYFQVEKQILKTTKYFIKAKINVRLDKFERRIVASQKSQSKKFSSLFLRENPKPNLDKNQVKKMFQYLTFFYYSVFNILGEILKVCSF
jgi:hypothetical protein